MTKTVLLIIVIAIGVALLALMLLGWRARARRQAHLPRPEAVPTDPGALIARVAVLYVATTAPHAPLERIAVAGLGFRARGALEIRERGLILELPAERDAFIPREELIGADRATWTIDRVVEPDGLLLVAWRLGGHPVDSYFRIVDHTPVTSVIDAVTELTPAATESGAS